MVSSQKGRHRVDRIENLPKCPSGYEIDQTKLSFLSVFKLFSLFQLVVVF